jgi:hypothetical protein
LCRSGENCLKILIFLSTLMIGCNATQERGEDFKVGVSHTILGNHHYKIISTGKASEESIESEDMFKKKVTSCQAAKDMYLKKISSLEKDQKYREFFLNVISQKSSMDNIYCEYVIEYKIPEIEKDK